MRQKTEAYYNTEDYIRTIHSILNDREHKIGFYDLKQPDFDYSIIGFYEKVIRLIPRINKSSKILILDAQSGSLGRTILTKHECKVETLHSNEVYMEYNLKKAREFDEKLQKKINCTLQFFEDIPFPGESFDIIIAQDVLNLTDDKLRVFREAHRTLKPEGRFVISDILTKENHNVSGESLNLPLIELYSSDAYDKLARKSQFQRVYTLDRQEQLDVHYGELAQKVDDSDSKLKPEVLKKLKKDILSFQKCAQDEAISWGLRIFQKQNS